MLPQRARVATARTRDPDPTILDLAAEAERLRPVVPELPHLRASAIETWLGRMVNEHGSALVFEGLAGQLRDAGWDADTVAECARFAEEERTHGALCGAVVLALGGAPRAPRLVSGEFPQHEDAPSRLEAALRNLISIACLSETVAVSLIGKERLEMPEGPLRDLLTRIYADEVGHARFGWRLLAEVAPSLDPATRWRLSRYLQVAFAHLEQHELSHLPLDARPPREGAALGLCSGPEARDLFYATVTTVIIPALEAHGIPARAAWEARAA